MIRRSIRHCFPALPGLAKCHGSPTSSGSAPQPDTPQTGDAGTHPEITRSREPAGAACRCQSRSAVWTETRRQPSDNSCPSAAPKCNNGHFRSERVARTRPSECWRASCGPLFRRRRLAPPHPDSSGPSMRRRADNFGDRHGRRFPCGDRLPSGSSSRPMLPNAPSSTDPGELAVAARRMIAGRDLWRVVPVSPDFLICRSGSVSPTSPASADMTVVASQHPERIQETSSADVVRARRWRLALCIDRLL